MKAFWKRTAILAAIGFALGLLVGLGTLALSGIGAYRAQYGLGRVLLHIALSGALGAVSMGTASIYSLEHWGVLRCTLVHFCIAMASVCAVGFAMGWFSLDQPATLGSLAACVGVYFVVWLVMYVRGKREVRQINAALRSWKAKQEEK